QHAQLVWNNGSWNIVKLAAQNTVTVNQRDVQQAAITDRDTVGLGTGTTFLIINTRAQSSPVPPQVQPQQSFQGAPPPPQSQPVFQVPGQPQQSFQAPPQSQQAPASSFSQ